MQVTRQMIDEALPGIREYIEGPEGQAVQAKLDAYREKAQKEGRVCPKCGRANKTEYCPTCSKRELSHLVATRQL